MEKERIESLVHRAQNGDLQAMEQLLEAAHTPVSYQCRKMMSRLEDAQDLTQEILLAVYQNIGKLEEPKAFWRWLNRITAMRCMNALTRTHVDLQFAEDEDGQSILDNLEEMDEQSIPDKAIDNAETARMIDEIVSNLPEVQRLSTLMYYYDEMSIKEIAQIMRVSENTVKSRLNLARKAIKEKVLDYEKQGVKLYSVSVLPFLWYFLRNAAKSEANSAVATACASSVMAAGGNISGGATAAVAGTQVTKGATTVIGSKVGMSTLSAMAKGTVGKVIAGVLAVAIAGGSTVALIQSKDGGAENLNPALVETDMLERTEVPEESIIKPADVSIVKNAEDYVIIVLEDQFPDESSDANQDIAYAYPKILLESEDVVVANQELYTYGGMQIDRSSESGAAGSTSLYKAWIINDMLVVYLPREDSLVSEWNEYATDAKVYVFDLESGTAVNRDELMTRMKYRGNAREKTREILGLKFDKWYGGYTPDFDALAEAGFYFEDQKAELAKCRIAIAEYRQKTIATENIDFNIVYYPTEDGSIRMIARIYYIAGAEGMFADHDLSFVGYEELEALPNEEKLAKLSKEAYEVYDELLRKGYTDDSMPIYYYAYLDTDQNGLDELIVADNQGTPDTWTVCELYTYNENGLVFCGSTNSQYDYLYYVNDAYLVGKHRMGNQYISPTATINVVSYLWNEDMTCNDPAISYNGSEWEYISQEVYAYYANSDGGFVETEVAIELQENPYVADNIVLGDN